MRYLFLFFTSWCFAAPISIVTAQFGHSPHAEHRAVVPQLLNGLRKIQAEFNYNPLQEHLYENVVVLCDLDAARQCIELRRSGRIKRLILGPNLINQASQEPDIVQSPHYEVYLHPSEWVKKCYEDDEPLMRGRCAVWFAGVDAEQWRPTPNQNRDCILLYSKAKRLMELQYMKLLKRNRIPFELIRYHNYDALKYKQALSRCRAAIFLSKSESQGIALAEAWSMDIPTLCWNPTSNSCPYLTPATGASWTTQAELLHQLRNLKPTSPRKWVLNNMTEEHSARALLQLFEDLIEKVEH